MHFFDSLSLHVFRIIYFFFKINEWTGTDPGFSKGGGGATKIRDRGANHGREGRNT